MTAALDLGSSEFRSLRREDQRLVARRLAAIYTVLDDLPEVRRMLEHSHIPFSSVSESLIVVGDVAREVSQLFSKPLVPLLRSGELGDQDPIARQVCAWMIHLLLPMNEQPNEFCVMTLPGGEIPAPGTANRTVQFLEHVVQLQGYDTLVMHPATAISLAELDDHGFTGISLSVGAESVTFSLTRHSVPVIESRFNKGSDEIIQRFAHAHRKYIWDAAGNSYLDLPGVLQWLQDWQVSVGSPATAEEKWFRNAYEELLLSMWFSLKRKVANCHESILKSPLPIVLSGAATQLGGFTDLVAESLQLSGIPIRASEIRVATYEPFTVARGLLIHGELAHGTTTPTKLTTDLAIEKVGAV